MLSILKNEHGSAMITVLGILLMLGLLGTAMVNTSTQDMNISDNFKRSTQAFYAAESGLEFARQALWATYVNQTLTNPPKAAGNTGSFSIYSSWLQSIGLPDSGSITVGQGQSVSQQQRIDSIRVNRYDMSLNMGTTLVIESFGSDNVQASQVVTEVLQITAGMFSGFGYAILAKNVNCIMCHLRVDNADRFYNTDPGQANTFDRAKVASLENLLLRTTSADSYIAGTLYTRGIVTDKSGNPITDLSPSNKGLEAWQIDGSGMIVEPMNNVKMTDATGNPLPQYGNLYLDYPSDPALMTDGELPTSFPAAIPDLNGNKLVDQPEFDAIANASSGSITGGVLYGVPSGSSYGGGSLPGSGNLTDVNGVYNGNLILVGTDADPIQINSQIAVDGDVIIQGKVVGNGEIFARGNVFVTGDVTYKDGQNMGARTYGQADDGTANALSLAAGGNIMVGDYLTPKKGDIIDPADRDLGNGTTEFSFAMSEMSLFNRSEWTKTQTQLPDVNGVLQPNPEYDPSYTPRYYTSGPNDPVYIYNKNYLDKKGKPKGTYYDAATKSWKGKEHVGSYDMQLLTQINPGDPQLSGASVIDLAPSAGWVTENQLKQFWVNDENLRATGDAFKFDGQLYTNNSIFSLTRKRSKTEGRMLINGSLVAADVGVLVPVDLRINYDIRMQQKLGVSSDGEMALTRLSWKAN